MDFMDGVYSPFFCFVTAGIMAYMDDQTKNLDKTKWTITLIAGGISTLIVLWYIIEASNSPFGSAIGFGAYIAALAAIGVVLSAFLLKSPGDNIRSGFDSLKKDINTKMNSSDTGTGSNTETQIHLFIAIRICF
jgi:hypothetical protein